MDLPAWNEWRTNLIALDRTLQGVIKQMESQSASAKAKAAQTKILPSSFFHKPMDHLLPAGIEFKEASHAMHGKYCAIDKALKGLQPYHPLSLTFFEPANHSERYRWLRDIALSVPIVLLKVSVGGSFGVLCWAMKRDPDTLEIGDTAEIEAARLLIQPVIPRVNIHLLLKLTLSQAIYQCVRALADPWKSPA